MYERKQPAAAPGKTIGQHIKKTHRQLDDLFTTASRWLAIVVVIYVAAPNMTPALFLRQADHTANQIKHFHYAAPRFAWMHKDGE